MKKIILKGEDFYRVVLDKSKDNCPICSEPLTKHYFTWQIFHGEAKANCGAYFQLMSYGVDKDKHPEQHKYAGTLGDNKIELVGVSKEDDLIKKFQELTDLPTPKRKVKGK